MDEKKMKCTVAGYEFDVEESIAKAAKVVQGVKSFVDEAVKASPEASLAWAGVCVILPILTKPSAAKQANVDGFTYVTSRISFYVKLEPLLLPKDQDQTASIPRDLKDEFEGHIVDLYQAILDFQIKSVLRFYRSWRGNLPRDLIDHEGWVGMLTKVQKLETTLHDDFEKINDAALRQRLENLDKNANESLETMHQLLSTAEKQLEVAKEQRDILSEQLQSDKEMLKLAKDAKYVVLSHSLRSPVPNASVVTP